MPRVNNPIVANAKCDACGLIVGVKKGRRKLYSEHTCLNGRKVDITHNSKELLQDGDENSNEETTGPENGYQEEGDTSRKKPDGSEYGADGTCEPGNDGKAPGNSPGDEAKQPGKSGWGLSDW